MGLIIRIFLYLSKKLEKYIRDHCYFFDWHFTKEYFTLTHKQCFYYKTLVVRFTAIFSCISFIYIANGNTPLDIT